LGLTDYPSAMASLAKKYGEAMGFYVFSQKLVVLNTPELIVEALAKEEITFRPPLPTMEVAQGITR